MQENDNLLTSFKYNQLNYFHDGMSVYNIGLYYGFIDKDGKELTGPKYGLAWDCKNGMARAISQRGFSFLNQEGEEVISTIYGDVRDFSEGLARAQLYY